MKINKKFQKVQRAIMAIILLIVMPMILHYYPDLLFFGNTICIISICYIVFRLITKLQDKSGQYLWIISFLFFSLIMSNGFYSYDKIISKFPMIKKIPSGILMIIVFGMIILSVCISFFYRYYIANIGENLRTPNTSESINEQKLDNNTSVNNYNDVNENSLDELSKKACIFKQAISFIATVFILIVVISGIIYVFSENEFILNNIHNQKFLHSLSQSVLLMGIGIFSVCSIIVMILYFFRICYKIIYEMFIFHEKSFWQDDLFLKCLSIFITIGIYLFSEETTTEEVIDATDNTVLRLLLYTLILAILAMISLIIFKLLQSIIDTEGLLRKCAENTSKIIIELINKTMEGILKIVENMPNILEALSLILGKIGKELKIILIDNDDDEDII